MTRTRTLDGLAAAFDVLAERHYCKNVLEFSVTTRCFGVHRTDAFTSNAVMHAGIPVLC